MFLQREKRFPREAGGRDMQGRWARDGKRNLKVGTG